MIELVIDHLAYIKLGKPQKRLRWSQSKRCITGIPYTTTVSNFGIMSVLEHSDLTLQFNWPLGPTVILLYKWRGRKYTITITITIT